MSARRRTPGERAKRPKRPRLTPEQNALAHEVAATIANLRAAGRDWDQTLIKIDETWPRLPYRLAIAGLFLAELEREKKRHGRGLQ